MGKTMSELWEVLDGMPNSKTEWLALDAWRKQPNNGQHFVRLKEEAQKRNDEAAEYLKGTMGWLPDQEYEPLTFVKLSDLGGWLFDFEKGEIPTLTAAVQKMTEFVTTTVKELQAANDTVKSLAAAYFCGDEKVQDAAIIKLLLDKFGKLGGAITSWQGSRQRTLVLTKHDTRYYRDLEEGANGYVLEPQNEHREIPDHLNRVFVRIFLTGTFMKLTEKVEDGIKTLGEVRQGRCVLHELTHTVLDTEDLRKDNGKHAYGRMSCGILAQEQKKKGIKPANKLHPLENADSLAYFASDLYLIANQGAKVEDVLEALR